jgi:hypothetical protein
LVDLYPERCFGEWYGFERPLAWHHPTFERYRPRRIAECWGLPWRDDSDRLCLDWYLDYRLDWRCGPSTLLVNLVSASAHRTFHRRDELLKLLVGCDVRFLDTKQDIRNNLFLVAQSGPVLTVDTSTAWLARFLRRPLYLIAPGGLHRHRELGVPAFVADHSVAYHEIELKTIALAARQHGLIV